ncbi:MAG: 5-formyltetrahydrofolate cyclo-ligase [Desulfurobacteriaceae bacterium]
MFTKAKLREEIKKKRLFLKEDEVESKSKEIIEKLKGILPENANSFMFYYPFKKEVNLLPLAEEFLLKGKEVIFPKVINRNIVPIRVFSLEEFEKGFLSIPEPPFNPERILKEIDVVFVPGIVFDFQCFRIGYGGGFYDRFLANFKVKTKIGICFDFQIVEKIPREHFDVPMDLVVSEKRVVRRSQWS